MGHIVLLGDSIFDNAAYVGGRPSVVEHLRQALPSSWTASLSAVDGASAGDVQEQIRGVDQSATNLFLSAGGNDAYNASGVLRQEVRTVGEAAGLLAQAQAHFRHDYLQLLGELMALGRPLAICTVYDAIPGLGAAERTALAVFNDVILRSAFAAGAAVIDLRLVCQEAADYSDISPIEPSAQGGAKIARIIADVALQDHLSRRRGTVYW